ncbi:hypothetical protein OHB14_36855 [Streptomyces sp. NBC_01613]|uniref:hypothetical protein n=1 Tax=Streptomyces sp. NBC_01613 TaxID=2975896 RepID=UPI0038659D8B
MISNLVLSIVVALFTIVAVVNSVASSRYARQAKASAERSAAAASRAEAARSRSAAARQAMSELSQEQPQPGPTHLTYEQLLPIATAIRRRETALVAGHGNLLPPFPACPTCRQAPTELLVRNDHPDQFLHDRIAFGFRPCGHSFTADAGDLYRATEQP